jgi:hypothetical protein
MEHPSANIELYDITEELLETDLIIQFGSRSFKVRQIALCIEIERSHVKDAELRVTVRDRSLPRSIRYPISQAVSWGVKYGQINRPEIHQFDEKYVARTVYEILSKERIQTLKAGAFYLVTVLFTVEGHKNAYCTAENTLDFPIEFPIGRTYRLVARLFGEGVSVSPRGFYVELDDWNRVYVDYDYAYVRAYRRIVRWAKKRMGPRPQAS